MAKKKKNIVQIGETYHTFPEGEVKIHNEFPVGTYKFNYNPLTGTSIEATHDLKVVEKKIYGTAERRVDKIVRKWGMMDRSLGVLLSGDKGMGKSLMANSVVERMMDEYKLPVFVVNSSFPGIVDYIEENIGEAVIVFDEFEKNFKMNTGRHGDDTKDEQTQFLSLFDGTSVVKRMYILTVNDLNSVNEFIQNRPGRAHYHMNFTYPDPDAIAEYVRDKVKNVSEEDIQTIIRLSAFAKINYDHLRALTTEMIDNPLNESVADLLQDLNIKNSGFNRIGVTITFEDRTIPPYTDYINPNNYDDNGLYSINFETPYSVKNAEDDPDDRCSSNIYVKVKAKDLSFDPEGVPFQIDKDSSEFTKNDLGKYDKISKVSFFKTYDDNRQFSAL